MINNATVYYQAPQFIFEKIQVETSTQQFLSLSVNNGIKNALMVCQNNNTKLKCFQYEKDPSTQKFQTETSHVPYILFIRQQKTLGKSA